MSGIYRSGFTLIELLIALALLGILAAVVLPNLQFRSPGYEREQFIARLNASLRLAWQNAIVMNKIHKVQFDIDNKRVEIHVDSGERDSKGEPVFIPVKGLYLSTSYTWPDQIEIKNFYIEGFDEMKRFGAGPTAQIWFYIVPEGLSQDVIINFVDTKDQREARARPVGLVLNPFSAQFKVYDSFQK